MLKLGGDEKPQMLKLMEIQQFEIFSVNTQNKC